jgi:nucleotide-binding universal stress UspA family protein
VFRLKAVHAKNESARYELASKLLFLWLTTFIYNVRVNPSTGEKAMYQNILLPLDGSRRAEAILPHVVNIAARFGARVIILIVEEPAVQLEHDEIINTERYLAERAGMRKNITAYALKIVNQFKEKDIPADFMIGKGDVVQSIIKTAEKVNSDLIAMASHGRSGWARTFYGSVAAGVLQKIDRPILMIRSRHVDAPVA